MKPFIVAELSASHCGSLERALSIVDAAALAGASGFKVQTWLPGSMVALRSYRIKEGAWQGRELADLYAHAHTPWDWHKPIFERAVALGMVPFGSAFDRDSVDFLYRLGVDRIKIASFELVDLGLIQYAATKVKAMILATGMASKAEISRAVTTCHWAGCEDITLAKCTSAYPASLEDAHLASMAEYTRSFGCKFGLSDHSDSPIPAVMATALGATYIEKHLNLKDSKGLDGGFALNPDAFGQLVHAVRAASRALGSVRFGPTSSESTELRRSLYLKADLPAGHTIESGDLVTARPALGLHPHELPRVIGKKLAREARAKEPLSLDMLE